MNVYMPWLVCFGGMALYTLSWGMSSIVSRLDRIIALLEPAKLKSAKLKSDKGGAT